MFSANIRKELLPLCQKSCANGRRRFNRFSSFRFLFCRYISETAKPRLGLIHRRPRSDSGKDVGRRPDRQVRVPDRAGQSAISEVFIFIDSFMTFLSFPEFKITPLTKSCIVINLVSYLITMVAT
jgi:hypothetical protein